MSPSNNTPRDPFQERLPNLLARTAGHVSPSPAFARQVRRRVESGLRRAPRSRFSVSFAALAPVGSVALVALILVAFAWALLGRGWSGWSGWSGFRLGSPRETAPTCVGPTRPYNPNPTPTAHAADHSVHVGGSSSASGVTITLDRAYADATQTVVTYTATSTNTQTAPIITLDSPYLVDAAAGAHYPALSTGASQLSGNQYEDIFVFAPLPQSALGTPQQLTFEATGVESAPPDGQTTPTYLTGMWAIPFTITPVAGTAIPVSLPAQTHGGVTIQVEEVDIAPAGGGIDMQNGGARVRYRMSGLPADMRLADATQYTTTFQTLSEGSLTASEGPACHDLLTLKLASGQELVPGFVLTNGEYVPDSPHVNVGQVGPLVGASGSVEIEALFYAPIPSGGATMTINSALVSSMRDGYVVSHNTTVAIDSHIVQGPWIFDLPSQP